MKRLWLIFPVIGFAFLLTNCAGQSNHSLGYEKQGRLLVKKENGSLIKEQKEVVKASPFSPVVVPDKNPYFPDPTRGYVENQTYNIYVKVWLDRSFRPKKEEVPDFVLPPKAIVEAMMPLGNHSVYAEGMMQTKEYGWKSVGVANKKVSINHKVYYNGHYGWYTVFDQSDFDR